MTASVPVRALCEIAQGAAAEIMAVYATAFATHQKADASPVTEADLRADRFIRGELERRFPGVWVVSEESSGLDGVPRDRFFLVDPLDGTREFVARNGEFTVNIALIESGMPVAGVVLAPVVGQLYFADRESGAWRRDARGEAALRTRPAAESEPLRVIGSRSHAGPRQDEWLARLQRPHTHVAAGSSLKFCRIAEGEADVYPRLGPTSQWDTAAGQAVLEAAGGAVLDALGAALRYGTDRPVLNPDFVALASVGIRVPPLAGANA